MNGHLLAAAFLLDVIVGDPPSWPHPVRWIGRAIEWCESRLTKLVAYPFRAKVAGAAIAVGLPGFVLLTVWSLLFLAAQLSIAFREIVEVIVACFALATRDLATHANAVWRALNAGSLDDARAAVGRLVGRDTDALSESEVVRATVEAIAESICDGVIAPLVYLALGGAPLAWAYKTVNTLDSMVGHQELPYRDIGWASARLDDVLNWVPARLTGILLVAATAIRFASFKRARHAAAVLLHDGGRHPSPNSGKGEAAMAGALGVKLGGTNFYEGSPALRPSIGTVQYPLTPARISEGVALMWLTSLLGLGFLCGVTWNL